MKWVLIAIVLSSWDGAPKENVLIAQFDQQSDCEKERDRAQATRKSHPATYICANAIVVKEGK